MFKKFCELMYRKYYKTNDWTSRLYLNKWNVNRCHNIKKWKV